MCRKICEKLSLFIAIKTIVFTFPSFCVAWKMKVFCTLVSFKEKKVREKLKFFMMTTIQKRSYTLSRHFLWIIQSFLPSFFLLLIKSQEKNRRTHQHQKARWNESNFSPWKSLKNSNRNFSRNQICKLSDELYRKWLKISSEDKSL